MTSIVLFILGFNALLIGFVLLLYVVKRRHEKFVTDLDEFCADLSADFSRSDPYVLMDGKWVRGGQENDRESLIVKREL